MEPRRLDPTAGLFSFGRPAAIVRAVMVPRPSSPLCYYCRRPMIKGVRHKNGKLMDHALTLDHKTPLSRGGSDRPENLCFCCRRCNTEKANLTVKEFMAVRGDPVARNRLLSAI